jgi:hypothetical protein
VYAGYTQLLFRLAMEPCHHADIIRARGYEALCAQASRSLLAVAAVAAMTATYQEEREAAAAATNAAAPRVGDDSGETVGGAAAVEDGELELEACCHAGPALRRAVGADPQRGRPGWCRDSWSVSRRRSPAASSRPVVGRGQMSLLADLDAWHSKP